MASIRSTRASAGPALRLLAAAFALAGCLGPQPIVRESNYLTYEHAFDEGAAAAVAVSAARICAEKRLLAVKTASACTLARCTTSFQCMDAAEAARHAPARAP